MLDRKLKKVLELESFIQSSQKDWVKPIHFEVPPQLEGEQSYDLAIPCFPMAKVRRTAPPKIAEALAKELKENSDLDFESVVAVKGYVNIRLKADDLAAAVNERIDRPLGESDRAREGERVLIEFSSPNIAKPFGVGHLRSTNIGAAIARIYQSLGAEVVRVNHLGDWGTQFGKLITAYKHFGSAEFVKGDPVNNLYKLYVQFHEEEKKDPALLDEAREWFVKLEKGDEEASELWKWFRDVSYHEFKRIYDRLGVEFDYVTGESYYKDLMPESIERIKEKSLLTESDGAMVVDLDEYKMPPCLIVKTDGSTLYATRDLATAEYRMKTFAPTQMVYVVGGEQKLHFRQVFQVLSMLGYEWAQNLTHVDFGLIKFPEGKMSTRKGNIVLLESVLDQAKTEAAKIIEEKHEQRGEDRKLTDDEKDRIAEQVGTGAVIFFDLKAKRTKDVLFDLKDILNFDGDTGPYLQYTQVRLQALLDKAAEEKLSPDKTSLPPLDSEEERQLARRILSFPAVVEAAAREYEPSMLSHALLDLAGDFNRFYNAVSVLKGEERYKKARLNMVQACVNCMREGLGLLGIQSPERM